MPRVALSAYLVDLLDTLQDHERALVLKAIRRVRNERFTSGLRVKKLRARPQVAVWEARVNDGDRLLFTYGRHTDRTTGEHTQVAHLWTVVHHDDVSRAARRRDFQMPEAMTWLTTEELGSWDWEDKLPKNPAADLEAIGDSWPDETRGAYRDLSEEYQPAITAPPGHLPWYVCDTESFDLWASDVGLASELLLTDEQVELLHQPLPLFVNGPAGSGKTTLALYKVLALQETAPNQRIAYIAHNPRLVTHAKESYHALLRQTGQATRMVDFLTYNAFAHQLLGRPVPEHAGRVSYERELEGFLMDKGLSGADRALFAADINALVRGGLPMEAQRRTASDIPELLTLSDYQRLPSGWSALPQNSEKRRQAHRLAELYQEHLASEGTLGGDEQHVATEALRHVMRERIRGRGGCSGYDVLVLDEVQDLTEKQLRVALMASQRPEHLFLAGDPTQALFTSGFEWRIPNGVFYERDWDVPEEVTLTHSFRAGKRTLRLARALTELLKREGGQVTPLDPEKARDAGREPVRVVSGEDVDGVLAEKNADVIVLVEHKAEAERLCDAWGHPFVWSVAEAKGLEADHVVLYKLPDRLRDVQGEAARQENRRRLRLHYVAVTRARESITIVMDAMDPVHDSVWAKDGVACAVRKAETFSPPWSGTSSKEEWRAKGDYYRKQGQWKAAAQCYAESGDADWSLTLRAAHKHDTLEAAVRQMKKGEGDLRAACTAFLRAHYPRTDDRPTEVWLLRQEGRGKEADALQAEHDEAVGHWDRAARYYETQGHIDHIEKAAVLYERAGCLEDAIRLLRQLGRGAEAQALQARYDEEQGRWGAAAAYHDAQGDASRAARLYQKGGHDEKALLCRMLPLPKQAAREGDAGHERDVAPALSGTAREHLEAWSAHLQVREREALTRRFRITYRVQGEIGGFGDIRISVDPHPRIDRKLLQARGEVVYLFGEERTGEERTGEGVTGEGVAGEGTHGGARALAEAEILTYRPADATLLLRLRGEDVNRLQRGTLRVPKAGLLVSRASRVLTVLRRQRRAVDALAANHSRLDLAQHLFPGDAEADLPPFGPVAPVERAECLEPAHADAERRLAVAMAQACPDVLFLGTPTGTSRRSSLVAELCHQCAAQGERVLVTSQSRTDLDSVLRRLQSSSSMVALRAPREDKAETEAPFVGDRAARTWLRDAAGRAKEEATIQEPRARAYYAFADARSLLSAWVQEADQDKQRLRRLRHEREAHMRKAASLKGEVEALGRTAQRHAALAEALTDDVFAAEGRLMREGEGASSVTDMDWDAFDASIRDVWRREGESARRFVGGMPPACGPWTLARALGHVRSRLRAREQTLSALCGASAREKLTRLDEDVAQAEAKLGALRDHLRVMQAEEARLHGLLEQTGGNGWLSSILRPLLDGLSLPSRDGVSSRDDVWPGDDDPRAGLRDTREVIASLERQIERQRAATEQIARSRVGHVDAVLDAAADVLGTDAHEGGTPRERLRRAVQVAPKLLEHVQAQQQRAEQHAHALHETVVRLRAEASRVVETASRCAQTRAQEADERAAASARLDAQIEAYPTRHAQAQAAWAQLCEVDPALGPDYVQHRPTPQEFEVYVRSLEQIGARQALADARLLARWVEASRRGEAPVGGDLAARLRACAHVVSATHEQAGAASFTATYGVFDVVIVDGAARATLPDLLMPALLGRRVVFVGDDRRLGGEPYYGLRDGGDHCEARSEAGDPRLRQNVFAERFAQTLASEHEAVAASVNSQDVSGRRTFTMSA